MEVGNEKRDIETLITSNVVRQCSKFVTLEFITRRTAIGFLRNIMKLSARPVMKRVNLWHKIFSISSACLMAMLTRTELMEGSIMTRSLSFLEIVRGVRSTSFVVLKDVKSRGGIRTLNEIEHGGFHSSDFANLRCFYFWFIVSFYHL